MTRLVVLWPTLLVVAAVLTLVTTLVGSSAGGYGFPFAWRIGGCPPPGIEISASCLLAIGSDWLSFGFDVLFYTLVGYGLLLAYAKYHARKRALRQVAI